MLNSGGAAITPATFEQCWGLDATGNWRDFREDDTGDGFWDLVQTRAANPANEIAALGNSTGAPWATPAYDRAGNMTAMPQPAAPALAYAASYDAWNRLVGLSAGGGSVARYGYDGLERRAVSQAYAGGTPGDARHLYYTQGWQVLEERVGASAAADRQFVWGRRYVDDLVLRDRVTGGPVERLYAVQDPNWNVTGVASSGGTVVERYAYDGYGVPAVLAPDFTWRGATLYGWETLFAGYRWGIESGLYYVRYRSQHPLLGQWLQVDPIHFDSSDINLYRYSNNKPIDL